MQAWYLAEFDREMGCTADELLGWLPGASGGRPIESQPGSATLHVGAGRLELSWHALPPRRIALVTLPRLAVRFRFVDLTDDERQRFMKHFDLYTQRGGG